MKSTLEVTVNDGDWPNLRIVCQRKSTSGVLTATTQSVLYDQGAVQFEAQLINHIRVMVSDVITAHKQHQQSKGEK